MARLSSLVAAAFVSVVSLMALQAAAEMITTDVIIIGAGASGITAAKTLADQGVTDFVMLEATDRVGGRVRNADFAGGKVELGANWVEGVNGPGPVNPVWTLAQEVNLRSFYSFFDNGTSNIYDERGFVPIEEAASTVEAADKAFEFVGELSKNLTEGNIEDISQQTGQRFFGFYPKTAIEMALDWWYYDFTTAEPPRASSLKNTVPLPTEEIFGPDHYFVADPRGYAVVFQPLLKSYLKMDGETVVDSRLKLGKVVNKIEYTDTGVVVSTADGSVYKAKAAIVTASIGVLQSNLINFSPGLPFWKMSVIYQFDMAVYTKIFLSFPSKFWPTHPGSEFMLYADESRGYYTIWQSLDKQFPDKSLIFVTVTDEQSKRVNQQSFNDTLGEVMVVLRKMFGENIPMADEIYYYDWQSDPYAKGSYSNWPIGVSTFEFKQLQAPVGRVYFCGEHTSELYSGYLHGALLEGERTGNEVIQCLKKGKCQGDFAAGMKPPPDSCRAAMKKEAEKTKKYWSKQVDSLRDQLHGKCT
ncbi:polyamine oxidase [Marchantia polymorpha subsp. ruderalis]|uniref:Amine oxidase domain-containing protein n=2 Tax=Marchantia polymorpha TaxID=3197 RepID=A0A176VTH0_MARPO|nr:hypothetical protein AXG93_4079s1280 [Marchantia polymorpha subsp. ruderalis]PTQ29662.1 hypothetical protein MARPO_0137s0029 [Marchantia polymorpha]BBN02833.1 hypothetical protein Mp_2g18520 [Marchantia polymorpha subsp. ruderalis]|eukprot:PTQ29662.1 hypothetical protein MARPO_0137s0029 [Marchantia polymorpha]